MENAGGANARCETGRLADLAHLVARLGDGPTLVVVGEVAAMSHARAADVLAAIA